MMIMKYEMSLIVTNFVFFLFRTRNVVIYNLVHGKRALDVLDCVKYWYLYDNVMETSEIRSFGTS